MKINFVKPTHCPPKTILWNSIVCSDGRLVAGATKTRHTGTYNKKAIIIVVKQKTKFRTMLILLHELCHVIVDIAPKSWRGFRGKLHGMIDKYL